MTKETAYRATTDATTQWVAEREAIGAARRDAAKAFLRDVGLPDDTTLFGTNRRVTGVQWSGDLPDGWRWDREEPGLMVPARRTKRGKEIARQMDAIPTGEAREALPGGMPDLAINKEHSVFMQPAAKVYGDHLYVTWPHPVDESDARHIDTAVWEQVPLSVYHLARENAEAVNA